MECTCRSIPAIPYTSIRSTYASVACARGVGVMTVIFMPHSGIVFVGYDTIAFENFYMNV